MEQLKEQSIDILRLRGSLNGLAFRYKKILELFADHPGEVSSDIYLSKAFEALNS